MFTGLIETVGVVEASTRRSGSLRLSIRSSLPVDELALGESIAVQGVCLTVARLTDGSFTADVVPETLARTTLGAVRRGSRVNLERSLRLADRLGGHLVQGHVDGTARVLGVSRARGEHRLKLEAPRALRPFLARKGSVALDGVSLTVAAAAAASFEVALIPETLARTTLGGAAAGDRVNVEIDLLARYLDRLLRTSAAGRKGGLR
jgi:riboflavin synthase